MPPIDLEVNISNMAGDCDLVTMELLEETCTWESSGHVTDDVTTICLGSRISETAGDSDLVTMERLLEMATWEANGHVTDDVACP